MNRQRILDVFHLPVILSIRYSMKILNIKNPFNAPVYHAKSVSSTFDAGRILAGEGKPHGTVITADFQEAGRGRAKRPWAAEPGKNLLFTVLLRYANSSSIPPALTLRTGLAVSLAIEDMVPSLAGSVTVKWPNDIMIGGRKVAGILTEWDGSTVYIGVGVNVSQRDFPGEYKTKAGSIIQAYPDLGENTRFVLLEDILSRLYDEIETPRFDASPENGSWRERLHERLYKRGETVTFIPGVADSGNAVEGTLSGLGPDGELLIIPVGEEKERAFASGELLVYS
jgi:BirA family biotin operon repressor/biotin-[acetyl-CoA-carboxylase] ligase